MSAFTIEMLRAAADKMRSIKAWHDMRDGLQAISSVHCREDIGLACRLPRPSRHRSMRARKKLGKRSVFLSWEPAAYIVSGTLYAHPIIIDRLKRSTQPRAER